MEYLKRIKELLEIRNWSIYQLAKKADIPQSTLSNLFIRNNAPTLPTLEKICKAFGITLEEFFKGTPQNESNESKCQEQIIISRWRMLSPESQKAFIEFLNTLKKD